MSKNAIDQWKALFDQCKTIIENYFAFFVIYNVLQFYVDYFEILIIADFLFRIDHEYYLEKGSNNKEGLVLLKSIW